MMLVAVEENPRFLSCLRISDTLLGLVFGAEGVFPLGCWADIMSTRLLVVLLVFELAFSLALATRSVWATWGLELFLLTFLPGFSSGSDRLC